MKINKYLLLVVLLSGMRPLLANDVEIVKVDAEKTALWTFHVTLLHKDTGWNHYADAWRVVDGAGNELAKRVLYHPHINEQPFTRSQAGIKIPPEMKIVYVEAHDKVHGWSKQRVKVDLSSEKGERFRVRRK